MRWWILIKIVFFSYDYYLFVYGKFFLMFSFFIIFIFVCGNWTRVVLYKKDVSSIYTFVYFYICIYTLF